MQHFMVHDNYNYMQQKGMGKGVTKCTASELYLLGRRGRVTIATLQRDVHIQ